MADVMSRAQRSALMSKVRSRDTGPERALRSSLRRLGVRYRSHRKIAGVDVDVVLPGRRTAVLVHGCFWHGCPRHYSAPKDNARFWKEKLARNRARDRRQLRELSAAGWSPVVVWEHELRRSPPRVVERLIAAAEPDGCRPTRPRRAVDRRARPSRVGRPGRSI